MPGLSLVAASNIHKYTLSTAVGDLKSDYSPLAEILYCDEYIALVFSGHDGYPCRFDENESYVIAFEGIVYNRPVQETIDKIHTLAATLSKGGAVEKNVSDFVDTSDGDFLCAVYSKRTSALIVFNDRYGRLHSFFHTGDGIAVLSREMKFLLHFMPEITVDRYGLSLFLMFEYTLGETTIFQSVRRFLPSGVLQIQLDTSNSPASVRSTKVQSLTVNFDETDVPSSRADCIERITSLFRESLKNRYSRCRELEYSCIADVSGGYDTRTVMAGLENYGGFTDYFTHELVSGDESHIAHKLGELYGKSIRTISASHELDYDETGKLMYATDCLVNGWTALTSWRDSCVKKELLPGKTACFMGFGGEFIRHPFHPSMSYDSPQSMVKKNILKNPLSAEWAAFLAGITYETFVDKLGHYFDGYSEQSLEGKLKHLYYEYYHILVAAGEDRTRRLFWTVQPLWGKDLYAYEINEVPLAYADYSFYTKFMRALDPKMLEVPIYGSSVRLNSPFNVEIHKTISNIRSNIREIVLSTPFMNRLYFRHKTFSRNRKALDDIAARINSVHDELKDFRECITKDRIDEFVRHGYEMKNYYRLLSVLMYFREVEQRFGTKINSDRK